MATVDLGVRIVLQDMITSGLANVSSSIDKVGASGAAAALGMDKLTASTKALGAIFAVSGGIFAILIGLMVESVKQAADIAQAMGNVQSSVAGANDNLQTLKELLIQVSNNSTFTAQDVAAMWAEMGRNGIDATQIIQGFGQAVVTLAQATRGDGVTAATLLATTFNALGDSTTSVNDVLNYLVNTVYNGQSSLDNLNEAMKNVLPTADEFNVSALDLTTALSILGDENLKGAKAGTALRYAIQDLVAPTGAAAAELKNLGIWTMDQTNPALLELLNRLEAAGGSARKAALNFDGSYHSLQSLWSEGTKVTNLPLGETFMDWALKNKILNASFYDSSTGALEFGKLVQDVVTQLSKVDQGDPTRMAESIREIFGQRAGQAMQAFLDKLKGIPGAWQAAQQIIAQDDATQKMQEQLNNLKDTVKELVSSILHLLGVAGSDWQTTFTNALKGINDHIGALTIWIDHHHQLIDTLFPLMTGLSGVATLLSGGAFMWAKHGKAIKDVWKGFGDLLDIIPKLGGGFGIFEDATRWLSGEWWKPIWMAKVHAGSLWKGIKDLADGIFVHFPLMGTYIKDFFLTGIEHFLDFGSMLKGIGGTISSGLGKALLSAINPSFWSGIGGTLLDGFKSLLTGGFWKGLGGNVLGGLKTLLTGGLSGALTGLSGLFEGLLPAIGGIASSFMTIVAPILLIIGAIALVVLLFTKFRTQGMQIVNVLKAALEPTFNSVKKTIEQVVNNIKKAWDQTMPKIKPSIDQLVTAFKNAQPFIERVGIIIGQVIKVAIGAIGGLVSGFIKALPQIINVFTSIVDIFTHVSQTIDDLIHGRWGKLFGDLKNILNDVKNFFFNIWDAVLKMFVGVVTGVTDQFDGLTGAIKGALRSVIGPIEGFLKTLSQIPGVGGLFSGVLNALHSIGLAEGGIVTAPTLALIGEGKEPEAVLPLSKMFNVLANARAAGAAESGNTDGQMQTIQINLDGKSFMEVVHNRLNKDFKANGMGRVFK